MSREHDEQLAELTKEFAKAVSLIQQGKRVSGIIDLLIYDLRCFNDRRIQERADLCLIDARALRLALETRLSEVVRTLIQDSVQTPPTREEKELSSMPTQPPTPAQTGASCLPESIERLDLSVRSRAAMTVMDVKTIRDLVQKTREDLLGIMNFGKSSLREVEKRLAEIGLSLGMTADDLERLEAARTLQDPQNAAKTLAALQYPIAALDLRTRTKNCMQDERIETVYELVLQTPENLLQIKNFGETCLSEVNLKLAEHGLRLGMTEEDIALIQQAAHQ